MLLYPTRETIHSSTPQIGDRVGAMRKEDGVLHFYVNGVDQGAGASNVPSDVYGVIDLYGQAGEATIIIHEGRLHWSVWLPTNSEKKRTAALPIHVN